MLRVTRPLGLIHLVHVWGEGSGASAHSNAHAIVIEVSVAAVWLMMAAEIARRIAGKINLVDKR